MKKLFFVFFLFLLVFLAGCGKQPTGQNPAPVQSSDLNAVDSNSGNMDGNQSVPEVSEPAGSGSELIAKIDECKKKESVKETDECIQALAVLEQKTIVCNQLEKFSVDFCLKEVALASKNAQNCLAIQEIFLKNECFYSVGTQAKDIQVCQQIEQNQVLQQQCFRAIGVSNANECIAESVIEKDECFLSLAKKENDPALCRLVSTDITAGKYQRDNCLEQVLAVFDNSLACDFFIEELLKANCFFETAKKQLNEILCEKTLSEKKDECIDFVAREKLDFGLCRTLSEKTKIDECVNFVAKNGSSEQECNQATDYSIKDECNKRLAVDTNNPYFCSKISYGQIKSDCFFEVAIATSEAETCKKIAPNRFEQKDSCFNTIALSLSDEKICENTHFTQNYIDCFSNIAVQTNNIDICRSMEKFTLPDLGYDPKFACFKEFAIQKKLSSACELITPSTPKQECIDGINA